MSAVVVSRSYSRNSGISAAEVTRCTGGPSLADEISRALLMSRICIGMQETDGANDSRGAQCVRGLHYLAFGKGEKHAAVESDALAHAKTMLARDQRRWLRRKRVENKRPLLPRFPQQIAKPICGDQARRAPLRSSSMLVATVVPSPTNSISCGLTFACSIRCTMP